MEQLLLALLTLGLLQINLNKESNREWGEMERFRERGVQHLQAQHWGIRAEESEFKASLY